MFSSKPFRIVRGTSTNKNGFLTQLEEGGRGGGVKCATISFSLEEIIKETQTLICIIIVYFLDVTVHFLSINQTRLIQKKNNSSFVYWQY